jgi:hypothetical protein
MMFILIKISAAFDSGHSVSKVSAIDLTNQSLGKKFLPIPYRF